MPNAYPCAGSRGPAILPNVFSSGEIALAARSDGAYPFVPLYVVIDASQGNAAGRAAHFLLGKAGFCNSVGLRTTVLSGSARRLEALCCKRVMRKTLRRIAVTLLSQMRRFASLSA